MLVGNTSNLLQQSREVKGLSEITSKLMAESRLEIQVSSHPAGVVFYNSILYFSFYHIYLSAYLFIYHLSTSLSYYSPLYLPFYFSISI